MKPSANEPTNQLRLQVFLSRNGVASRRDAMELVQSGRVTVNGQVVKEPSTPVVPGRDKITFDGKLVEAKQFSYILLNKPPGFVTTKEDAHAERTVMDLLPRELQHVVPVGRLDRDSEGLLLLTNDGDLAFRLTHPKFGVDKIYLVWIGGKMADQKRKRLEHGVMVEGIKTAPCKISDYKETDEQSEFLLTIHEGRKRQVRLMMKAVGCAVRYLKRVAQGPLKLSNLPTGKWRELNPEEIKQLKDCTGGY
jgi:23S rRNA pseudouridine2605 synthase